MLASVALLSSACCNFTSVSFYLIGGNLGSMEYFANPIAKRETLLLKGKVNLTITLFLIVGTESYCGMERNRNVKSARQGPEQ